MCVNVTRTQASERKQAIKHDLIYCEIYNNFMVTLKEMKEVVDHVSNQNDVIVCTLIKILEAIDNKEIQGIKVMLTEKALQN